MNKSLLEESVTTDITVIGSDGDNTDGCNEDFVGFTEYRVNCTVEQTKSSTSTSERSDGGTSTDSLVFTSVISKMHVNMK